MGISSVADALARSQAAEREKGSSRGAIADVCLFAAAAVRVGRTGLGRGAASSSCRTSLVVRSLRQTGLGGDVVGLRERTGVAARQARGLARPARTVRRGAAVALVALLASSPRRRSLRRTSGPARPTWDGMGLARPACQERPACYVPRQPRRPVAAVRRHDCDRYLGSRSGRRRSPARRGGKVRGPDPASEGAAERQAFRQRQLRVSADTGPTLSAPRSRSPDACLRPAGPRLSRSTTPTSPVAEAGHAPRGR